MKSNLIKVIAVLLVILTVFSVPSIAFDKQIAEITTTLFASENETTTTSENGDEDETTTKPTEPTEPTESTEQTEPTEPEEPELNFDEIPDDTIVGRMYICTQQVGLGHSWIYIESDFNGDMPVGCYTLKPYQGVSMGAFFISRSDGPGLYYNVEAYCANKYGLKHESSLGMDITKKQLLKVSKRIKQWDWWGPYFNCTFFAAEIWNCVSKKKVIPLMFPLLEKIQILILGGKRKVEMKDVEPSDCYKQRGVGSNAKIYQVKEGTLDSKLM